MALPFLLELMHHMGFPRNWVDWVASLFAAASTRVMINGTLGPKILHARGLRQEDPLSPMLFLLMMEALSALIRKADQWLLFQQLRTNMIPYHASLYADDVIMFVSPTPADMHLTMEIFSLFKGALGLGYNMGKCQVVSIRCSEVHVAQAITVFPCQAVSFLIKYLGLPLSVSKLPNSTL
jgi:hypothetical protein